MKLTCEKLPKEICDKIAAFIPRDRDMKSPISDLIKTDIDLDNPLWGTMSDFNYVRFVKFRRDT